MSLTMKSSPKNIPLRQISSEAARVGNVLTEAAEPRNRNTNPVSRLKPPKSALL